MVIDKFVFENKHYIIAFQDDKSIVFYREDADLFDWFSDPIVRTKMTHDVVNSFVLLRSVASKLECFLYVNKPKYFCISLDNERLKSICFKFASNLHGYKCQLSGNTINVFKVS